MKELRVGGSLSEPPVQPQLPKLNSAIIERKKGKMVTAYGVAGWRVGRRMMAMGDRTIGSSSGEEDEVVTGFGSSHSQDFRGEKGDKLNKQHKTPL
jgi:hypothetical protein